MSRIRSQCAIERCELTVDMMREIRTRREKLKWVRDDKNATTGTRKSPPRVARATSANRTLTWPILCTIPYYSLQAYSLRKPVPLYSYSIPSAPSRLEVPSVSP